LDDPDGSAAGATLTAIRPRRPRFDLSDTPTQWVPGDPQTTQTINVLHLLLPPGERWFCDVYREALPLITDERLRADVKGFMGQEAVHARAHDGGLAYMAARGIDTSTYEARAEWLRTHVGGPRPFGLRLGPRLGRAWLNRRLAAIAAIEHYTSILGTWIVENSAGLDRAGADPQMMDLLRWHGAEEVEHRHVAFDAYQDLSGSYVTRVVAMLGVTAVMLVLWIVGSAGLVAADPTTDARFRPREFRRAVKQGRLPSLTMVIRSLPRYLARNHHPSNEPGSRELALAYLAGSPGVASSAGVASA
jgi:hypothetical protein